MRLATRVAGAVAVLALAGCARNAPHDDAARMVLLKDTYDRLHARLEKASAAEPLVTSAFAAHGQVVLAMRSGLVEELARNVARRYLDRVTLDMNGFEAHASGEMGKQTFLGHLNVGNWKLTVDLADLKGTLRAGVPRVGLRSPNLIDIDLPVDVQEAEGKATLHFAWTSSGVANVVCKNFELTREIRGYVLAQRHVLSGSLRLDNTGESLTATPLFPDRRIQLALDVTPASWAVVEAALRSQSTAGTCGTLMNTEKALAGLKELAATGITIKLPDAMFPTVSLPARLRQSVKVNERTVALCLTADHVRIEAGTLWSSVSVQVVHSVSTKAQPAVLETRSAGAPTGPQRQAVR